MLEFESIHKWKTAVLYLRNCLVKFCRINDENPDKIGVPLGYIFFVTLLWQRYKDSNLNIRSQSPLCYRYTIPLFIVELSQLREILYNGKAQMSTHFLIINQI